MNTYYVDLILLAILALSVFYGWHLGTINVVARVGALVLAYHLARTYATIIAEFIGDKFFTGDSAIESSEPWAILSIFVDTDEVRNAILGVIIFIIIFVLVNWAVRRIAYALTSIFGSGVLSKINRAVGAFIGLILMMGIIIIIESIIIPTFIDMGFAFKVEEFFLRSHLIMPFLREIPLMFN